MKKASNFNWGSVHKASLPNMLLAMAIGLVLATLIAWIGLQLGVSDAALTIGLTVLWPVLYGLIVSRRSASATARTPPAHEDTQPVTVLDTVQVAAPAAATPVPTLAPDPMAVAKDLALPAEATVDAAAAEEAELQAQLALLNQLVRQSRQTGESR